MLINPISQSTVYTGGAGIDIAGNVISLDPAHQAVVAGAVQESTRNQPNGFAGLDAQSTINALVKVRFLTAAEANAIVPAAGELIVTSDTKELRFGDGVSYGGYSASLSGTSCLYISCIGGTAVENGNAVITAIAVAKLMTPYGNPLSATNRITILLGLGDYNLSDQLILDFPFIDIVGISQKGCRVNTGGSVFRINPTCTDFSIRNITFFKSGAWHGWQWTLPADGTVTINMENVTFEGISTDTVFSSLNRSGGTFDTVVGNCTNVRTNCIRLFTSNSAFAGHTWAVNMTDCSAGQIVGNTGAANKPIITGTWRRCTLTPSALTNHHFEIGPTGVIQNCDWLYPMNYLQTGARIMYTRFKLSNPTGLNTFNGAVAGVTPYIAHCEFPTGSGATTPGPFGANIGSNLAGATAAAACNCVSDS